MHQFAIEPEDCAQASAAESHCACDDGVEDRPDICPCLANDTEDLAGGGLLLSRLGKRTRQYVRQYMSASPSKKSVQRFKAQVRELLVPSNTDPWPEVRDDLNRSLRGWSNYFCLGSPFEAFLRPKPARQSPTLPMSGERKRSDAAWPKQPRLSSTLPKSEAYA